MTDSLDRRIHAQQVCLLYAQAPMGFIPSVLIAPILTLILWDVIPHQVLLIWLALLETTLLIRIALTVAFQRCPPVDHDPVRWATRYIIACAASGVCWGGTVILLILSPSLVYDTLIALIIGGVLMGGVLTMTPVLNAYLAYALPLVLPPVLWLLLQDDLIRTTMGVTGILYLLLAVGTAHRYHQTLTQSLRLALSNGELAQSFAVAKEQAEDHYQRLVEALAQEERLSATAQKQQTLLAHASRLNTLGEMASGLVHEINQPITAINLYTEAGLARLRNQASAPAELRETLEKIAAQSARASAIIQKIRSFARQGKPQYAQVHVHELLDEIADFLNLEVRRHAIRISYDASPELPLVLADGLQVQQIILNLVRNAIDAMSTGQRDARIIVISARSDQKVVEIAVKDTGTGLDPDTVSQLLHPFFTTKPNGLGLGLPISQTIVEAHGGRLWATANSGAGATFHFTLPTASCADHSEYPVLSATINEQS
ncbi:MAG TPA: ATP-binding protein [Candidatus Competibacteraceae bacterium]|nr:ATP-binding protein [Candidatus Competibacteraceae bacterium]HRZ06349.1 ATP-binding protein [Candidatus Competibacteraceae bacterium]HSA46772.1 ATP-binding protein [Candidatus Competibacteraceae bacterium]